MLIRQFRSHPPQIYSRLGRTPENFGYVPKRVTSRSQIFEIGTSVPLVNTVCSLKNTQKSQNIPKRVTTGEPDLFGGYLIKQYAVTGPRAPARPRRYRTCYEVPYRRTSYRLPRRFAYQTRK
jgi:hypothetical protein